MKMKSIFFAVLFATISCSIFSQNEREIAFTNYHRYFNDGQKVKDADKAKSIQEYRQYFATHPYRTSELKNPPFNGMEYLDLLSDDGQFKDLMEKEKEIFDHKMIQSTISGDQQKVGGILYEAYNRIWRIAESYRQGKLSEKDVLTDKYLNAIIHYSTIELDRPNEAFRFHASCFALPTAAVHTYFCFLKQMDEVENGNNSVSFLKDACDMLKAVALQAWTQPFRHDETDKNVVQLDRFRNHVWWVGGNALGYRPLLPVAFMYRSIPMVDLLSDVCQKGITTTSHNTYQTAFWTEGFTADGAGWGHGKQCLVWGYPIDGTSNALSMLGRLKGSPWAKKLSRQNVDALMNYFRGSNWYYYKGFILPCLDRYSMVYNVSSNKIRYAGMVNMLLKEWKESFTQKEQAELNQLSKEIGEENITMDNYPEGTYEGTRWFYDNDDLIKKNRAYHIIVNMASVRCDGLESASPFADGYNFFTTDGLTFFQKSGDEYRKIIGAFDVTATPGVTAREGMENLIPVVNWRGYCSKHNFAAAATNHGENAVAGFIFEKMNASEKENVNDRGSASNNNKSIYGVKAYKSYFMLGDYFIALGAGVNNLFPELDGMIRTTIDQTVKENEVYMIQNGVTHPAGEGIQSLIVKGKPIWVAQKNKFAYTILPKYTKNAFYVCETKKTDWLKRNASNANIENLPATADIFRVWIDHGQKVTNGTYGYVVYAGNDVPKPKLPFNVLRNDTLIQAVVSSDQKVIEAVFYKANALLKGKNISLKASYPCAVLIEDKGHEYAISVTDPTMNGSLKQIILTFGGKNIAVDLPQGEDGGKPSAIRISHNNR